MDVNNVKYSNDNCNTNININTNINTNIIMNYNTPIRSNTLNSTNLLNNNESLNAGLIESALITPYEKVLNILNQTISFVRSMKIDTDPNTNFDNVNNNVNRSCLFENLFSELTVNENVNYFNFTKKINDVSKDLQWVVKKIQSHTLYTYDAANISETGVENNAEINTFLGILSDYSETNEVKRRNQFLSSNTDETRMNIKRRISKEDMIKIPISECENENSNLSDKSKVLDKLIQTLDEVDETNSQACEDIPFKLEGIESNGFIFSSTDEKNFFTQKNLNKKDSYESFSTNLIVPDDVSPINRVYIEFSIMNKDFDIFNFEKKHGHMRVMSLIGHKIFQTLGLTYLIEEEKLVLFLNELSFSYNQKVFYHNSLHGADVAQTLTSFLQNSDLEKVINLKSLDLLSMVIAALGHDVGHPGTNNSFQINSYSHLAITYNDQSVLENYHSALLAQILLKDKFNILENLNDSEYKLVRKRMILCILATDMQQHAKVVSNVRPKISKYITEGRVDYFTDSDLIFDEQQKVIDFVLHCADLSHNTKKFKISFKWTSLLMEEFWLQGDMEKSQGLRVSFLCDRTNADVPKSQIGFIRGIVCPTFEVLLDLLPSLVYLKEEMERNLEEWTSIVEDKNSTTILGRSPKRKTYKKY